MPLFFFSFFDSRCVRKERNARLSHEQGQVDSATIVIVVIVVVIGAVPFSGMRRTCPSVIRLGEAHLLANRGCRSKETCVHRGTPIAVSRRNSSLKAAPFCNVERVDPSRSTRTPVGGCLFKGRDGGGGITMPPGDHVLTFAVWKAWGRYPRDYIIARASLFSTIVERSGPSVINARGLNPSSIKKLYKRGYTRQISSRVMNSARFVTFQREICAWYLRVRIVIQFYVGLNFRGIYPSNIDRFVGLNRP